MFPYVLYRLLSIEAAVLILASLNGRLQCNGYKKWWLLCLKLI